MSENEEELKERISQAVERKIVEHRIVFDERGTTDEAERNKAIITDMALQAFEDKKEELMNQYPQFESQIETVESGFELDRLKEVLGKVRQPSKPIKSPPSGKVKMPLTLPYQGETYGSGEDVVNAIYDQLEIEMDKRRNPKAWTEKYDPQKHKQLQRMVDKLLISAIRGEQARGQVTKRWRIWRCSCGHDNFNREYCEVCGQRCGEYGDVPQSGDVLDRRTYLG